MRLKFVFMSVFWVENQSRRVGGSAISLAGAKRGLLWASLAF